MAKKYFPPRKVQAIILLATTDYQLKEIAERVGVNERTLRRWRQEPEFQKAFTKEAIDKIKKSNVKVRSRIIELFRVDPKDNAKKDTIRTEDVQSDLSKLNDLLSELK